MKSKKIKCECPTQTNNIPGLSWYNHAPNKCRGDVDIKKYNRDGKVLNLCSCCCLSTDIEVL